VFCSDPVSIKKVPTTLYYLGPNKVRFWGVATINDVKYSRCIVVNEDKRVLPNVSGGSFSNPL